ncbi:sigma-70 region 4 domain-containing protein [Actinoplanes sp. NPDC051346]|uniref:RNA polymerase sigma factor n=1 Tax=Actinoplanes sp. NPDC051346 TaxID=3155048 RepID=UPI0034191498
MSQDHATRDDQAAQIFTDAASRRSGGRGPQWRRSRGNGCTRARANRCAISWPWFGPLPHKQREVLAWTIDGYSVAEVAEFTGANAATVRSHLRHARKTLAEEIARIRVEDGREAGGGAG